jgi:hypothetical protein
MSNADDLPTDLHALARYVADRISANNYDEAFRATLVLAARLQPESPAAWTSQAELLRLRDGYSATIWSERHRWSDVDVPVYALAFPLSPHRSPMEAP